jgi:putative hydrolase of the HAD superfamily
VEWSIPQVTRVLFKNLGIEYDDDFVDDFFNAYYQPVDERLYVYDDVIDTLRNIKAANRVIGLVSNTIFPEETHRRELNRFGIDRYLDFAIFSSTFGLRKPHPDIFMKAANMAGFAPAECVYIGDRYVEDVQGPAGIGMPAILKCKENRTYPDEIPEDIRRITNLSELENHLDFE